MFKRYFTVLLVLCFLVQVFPVPVALGTGIREKTPEYGSIDYDNAQFVALTTEEYIAYREKLGHAPTYSDYVRDNDIEQLPTILEDGIRRVDFSYIATDENGGETVVSEREAEDIIADTAAAQRDALNANPPALTEVADSEPDISNGLSFSDLFGITAHADGDPSSKVYVLNEWEIAVQVWDVNKQPIGLAAVTLKLVPLSNQTPIGSLTGTTGADGAVLFGSQSASLKGDWRIENLTVSKGTYRTYSDYASKISGGNAPIITLVKDDGSIYAQALNYEDQTVGSEYYPASDLIQNKEKIMTAEDNDHDKFFNVYLASSTAVTGKLKVELYQQTSSGRKSWGVREITGLWANVPTKVDFKGIFGRDMIGGAPVLIDVTDSAGKVTTIKPNVTVEKSAYSSPWYSNIGFSVGSGLGGVKVDPKCPGVGGLEVGVNLPKVPLELYVSLDGTVSVGWNVSLGKYASGDGWKNRSQLNEKGWMDQLYDDWGNELDAYTRGQMKMKGSVGSFQVLSKMEVSVSAKGVGTGEYDKTSGYLHVNLTGVLQLQGTFGVTQYFILGVFPVYLGFDITLTAAPSATFGVRAIPGKIQTLELDFAKVGFSITLGIEVGVYAGAGLRNFISVEVRAHGAIDNKLGFPARRGSVMPEFDITGNVGVDVTLCVMFIKAKYTLYNNVWTLYSNHDRMSLGDLSLVEIAQNPNLKWENMLNLPAWKATEEWSDSNAASFTSARISELDAADALPPSSDATLTQVAASTSPDPHAKFVVSGDGRQWMFRISTVNNLPTLVYNEVIGSGMSGTTYTVLPDNMRSGQYRIDLDYDVSVRGKYVYALISAADQTDFLKRTKPEDYAKNGMYLVRLEFGMAPTQNVIKLIADSTGRNDKLTFRLPTIRMDEAATLAYITTTNAAGGDGDYVLYCSKITDNGASGYTYTNPDDFANESDPITQIAIGRYCTSHTTKYDISYLRDSSDGRDTNRMKVIMQYGYNTYEVVDTGRIDGLQVVRLPSGRNVLTYFKDNAAYYAAELTGNGHIDSYPFKDASGKQFIVTANKYQYVTTGNFTKLVAMKCDQQLNAKGEKTDKYVTTMYLWNLSGDIELHGPREIKIDKHMTFFSAAILPNGAGKAVLTDTDFNAVKADLYVFTEGGQRSASAIGLSTKLPYTSPGKPIHVNGTVLNDGTLPFTDFTVCIYQEDINKPIASVPVKSNMIWPGEKWSFEFAFNCPSNWKGGTQTFSAYIRTDNLHAPNGAETSLSGDGYKENTDMLEWLSLDVTHSNTRDADDEMVAARSVDLRVGYYKPIVDPYRPDVRVDATVRVYGVNAIGRASLLQLPRNTAVSLAPQGLSGGTLSVDLVKIGAFEIKNGRAVPKYQKLRYEVAYNGKIAVSEHFMYDFIFGTQAAYTDNGVREDTPASFIVLFENGGVRYGVEVNAFEGYVIDQSGDNSVEKETNLATLNIYSDYAEPDDNPDLQTNALTLNLEPQKQSWQVPILDGVSYSVNVDIGDIASLQYMLKKGNSEVSKGTVDVSNPSTPDYKNSARLARAPYGYSEMTLNARTVMYAGEEYFELVARNNSETPAKQPVIRLFKDGNVTQVKEWGLGDGDLPPHGARTRLLSVAEIRTLVGDEYDTIMFTADSNALDRLVQASDADGKIEQLSLPFNRDISAASYTFSNPDYVYVTVTPYGNGSVSGGGRYRFGDTPTITATPGAGSEFEGWHNPNGALVSTEPILTLLPLEGDVIRIGVFTGAGAGEGITDEDEPTLPITGDNYLPEWLLLIMMLSLAVMSSRFILRAATKKRR